jgi:hypothetical protein
VALFAEVKYAMDCLRVEAIDLLDIEAFEISILKLTKLTSAIAYTLPTVSSTASLKLGLLAAVREINFFSQEIIKFVESKKGGENGSENNNTNNNNDETQFQEMVDKLVKSLSRLVGSTKLAMQSKDTNNNNNNSNNHSTNNNIHNNHLDNLRPTAQLSSSGSRIQFAPPAQDNIEALTQQQMLEEEYPFFRVLQYCEPETSRLVKELLSPLSQSDIKDFANCRTAVSQAAAIIKQATETATVNDWKTLLLSLQDIIKAVRAVVNSAPVQAKQNKQRVLFFTSEMVTVLSGFITITKNLRDKVYGDDQEAINNAYNTLKERAKSLLSVIANIFTSVKKLNEDVQQQQQMQPT